MFGSIGAMFMTVMPMQRRHHRPFPGVTRCSPDELRPGASKRQTCPIVAMHMKTSWSR
jgi:hypothetical protein